jgi:DNA-binding XRE family transcriptional regulator
MTNTHRPRPENKTRDRRTVKELREMFGATQEELARKAGFSGGKLSLYESGFVDLSDGESRRLNKALNALSKENTGMPGITSLIDGTYLEKCAAWNKKQTIKSRRSFRRQAKLPQIKLAREIGIPRKKLIHWEAGRLELSDAEFAKWQQVVVAAIVKQKKADPWARLEARIEVALEAHKGRILDDPLIAEIMESFRRENAELERRQAKPTDESYKVREFIKRLDSATTEQEQDAIIKEMTEGQKQAVEAGLELRAAAHKSHAAELEAQVAALRSKIEGG